MSERRWRRLAARAARRLPPFGVPRPLSPDPWAWLEPYPVLPGTAGQAPPGSQAPAGSVAPPGSLSIAFVAALQRLPPDQRAALVLSDVLDFALADVAEILDCAPAAAGDLLRRARAAIEAQQLPPGDGDPGGDVAASFAGAFARGDIAGITALLTTDAALRMRPLPVAYRGRAAARHFLTVVAFPGGTRGYRLVATSATGQPAFGCYLRDPAAILDHACGLVVLTLDGGRIAAIDRFTDNSLLSRFGLPRTLRSAAELHGYLRDHDL